jgi:hypothetical protein
MGAKDEVFGRSQASGPAHLISSGLSARPSALPTAATADTARFYKGVPESLNRLQVSVPGDTTLEMIRNDASRHGGASRSHASGPRGERAKQHDNVYSLIVL